MDKEYGVSLGDDEKVLKLNSGDGCKTLCINLKPVNCVCYMGELYGIASTALSKKQWPKETEKIESQRQ